MQDKNRTHNRANMLIEKIPLKIIRAELPVSCQIPHIWYSSGHPVKDLTQNEWKRKLVYVLFQAKQILERKDIMRKISDVCPKEKINFILSCHILTAYFTMSL